MSWNLDATSQNTSSASNNSANEAAAQLTGTVVRKSQGIYSVRTAEGTLACELSSRLRKTLIYPSAAPTSLRHRVKEVKGIGEVDPVAVGDQVSFHSAGPQRGLITAVLPRLNALSRPAAGNRRLEHVIVANVGQVVAVFAAAQPAPKWELLDRYLVAAEAADVPTLIAITKLDALPEGDAPALHAEMDNYRKLGYRVTLTSTVTGEGLADFCAALRDKVSVFVGKSGVGKTSLLNAVEPGLGLRVKAVSALTEKGRHSTTHLEMFDLAGGGQMIDTPGMREFGLWALSGPDLAHGFVEMRPYIGQCKFGLDCTHLHEPGCAVRAALAAGRICQRRYDSYRRLQAD
ncbi:MAG: ribosome small subunit-dependent GTPase A [Anaerolineales bacterium]|nr:ribosome small subunit-dependent GTPase A [Anaerolineales bacterium]